jgi:hypothetical protein
LLCRLTKSTNIGNKSELFGPLEQLILQAMMSLGKNAYGVTIYAEISKLSGRECQHGPDVRHAGSIGGERISRSLKRHGCAIESLNIRLTLDWWLRNMKALCRKKRVRECFPGKCRQFDTGVPAAPGMGDATDQSWDDG